MILDSSFLIDLMEGDAGAVAQANVMDMKDTVQRIPAQTVYELYVGGGYTETPETEISKVQAVIEDRPLIETTEQIAKVAGRIDGELRKQGSRVAQGDVIIGATARHFDEPVLTNDASDFEKIPEVGVVCYE